MNYLKKPSSSRFLEEIECLEAHIKSVQGQIKKQRTFLSLELSARIPDGAWVKSGGEFLGKVKEFTEDGVALVGQIYFIWLGGFYSYKGYVKYSDESHTSTRIIQPDEIEEAGVFPCEADGCEEDGFATVEGDTTRLWCDEHAIAYGKVLRKRHWESRVESGEIMPVEVTVIRERGSDG